MAAAIQQIRHMMSLISDGAIAREPPVYHYATQADPVGMKPLSEFCARQKGVMNLLLEILETSPQDAAILRRWGGM